MATNAARRPQVEALTHSEFTVIARVDSLQTAMVWACHYLGAMRPLAHKPAVILDIDGTVLLNSKSGTAQCVAPFRRFCERCAKCGIAIFCVTARTEEAANRERTLAQLNTCGIAPLAGLFMQHPGDAYIASKERHRMRIAETNDWLVSFGDQWGDLTSGDATGLLDTVYYVGVTKEGKGIVKLPSEYARGK